jgi:hypothetical protein
MLSFMYSVVLAQAVPNGDARPPGELGAKFNDLVGYAKYVGFSVTVLALIGAAALMAVSHRRGSDGGEAAGGVVKVLVSVAIIAGASGLVGLFV